MSNTCLILGLLQLCIHLNQNAKCSWKCLNENCKISNSSTLTSFHQLSNFSSSSQSNKTSKMIKRTGWPHQWPPRTFYFDIGLSLNYRNISPQSNSYLCPCKRLGIIFGVLGIFYLKSGKDLMNKIKWRDKSIYIPKLSTITVLWILYLYLLLYLYLYLYIR